MAKPRTGATAKLAKSTAQVKAAKRTPRRAKLAARGEQPVIDERPQAQPKPPAKRERLTTKPNAIASPAATVDEAGLAWIAAGAGYQITLEASGGSLKLAAKTVKGKRLASVPKEVRDGDVADQLEALRDWLVEHDRECSATVEQWMLRSHAVPRAVLQAVWDDPAWRRPLENAVVVAVGPGGGQPRSGLFRGADPKKGIGVVDSEGETAWLDAECVAIPHPILIAELDAWRELVTQLGVTQGIAQLHRETYLRPAEGSSTASPAATSIDQFEDGKFAMLMHVLGKTRQLGYKVRGGFATCKVWDAGAVSEARYWIGADSPDAEAYTGQLSWVDARERGLTLAEVGPVAFSEGMRMAASIYAARVVEKPEQTT